MQLQATCNITQAVNGILALPSDRQQQVFDFIDFLYTKEFGHLNQQTADDTARPPKRQFGQYAQKGGFKIHDDFDMSEQELIK